MRYRLMCIVGARPNFMKMAPIIRALNLQFSSVEYQASIHLVHTGQHYDTAMKHAFFEQLGLPEPEVDLGVGSGSHAVQTAKVMSRIEPELDRLKPHLVIVVGDVNSTLAVALVAAKKQIPVAHVEAGLRSGDWDMPEEVNRVLTDRLSDLLFTSEKDAEDNLRNEGLTPERIHFVGNVMIDALLQQVEHAPGISEVMPAKVSQYALATLHRPSNVDDKSTLARLVSTLTRLSRRIAIVMPLHPRTRAKLDQFGLLSQLEQAQVFLLEPAPYLSMLTLMKNATLVLTDSGGIQEETTVLGVPCLTLRDNTERPITLSQGTNTLVGSDPERITAAADQVLDGSWTKATQIPQGWDGKAAERIASKVASWLEANVMDRHLQGNAYASQRTLV